MKPVSFCISHLNVFFASVFLLYFANEQPTLEQACYPIAVMALLGVVNSLFAVQECYG